MGRSLVILFILSSFLFANGKPTSIDKEIMNLSLNYEFEKADKLLAEQFKTSDDLKNHFLYLNVEVIKVIKATDEVPFREKRVLKDSLNQKLISYAEEVIEKYEDKELSLYDQFYFGSLHGFLGRLYGVSRSWMSAFSSGKEGRNIMLDIIDEYPSFTDAYLLVGMMNYYADRMGGITEFIASILGLSGDRNIGLGYLEKVEKTGEFNNWQATMILIELYSRMEGNKFASLPLLKKIVNRFPNNSHFINWLCYEYINLHQLKNAGEMIVKDTDNNINDFVKANYYHNVGEYEKSNILYNNLLKEEGVIWPWVFENSKYVRVLNYFFLDDQDNAIVFSKNLNEMYKQRFDKLLKKPNLGREIKEFITSVNLNDNEAIKNYIDNSPNFSGSKLAESEYYYYQAIYQFKKSNLEEAEELFVKSKLLNPEDFGIKASQYLVHIYKVKTVSVDKVENLLDEIDDYDDDGLDFFAQDLEEKYDL